MALKIPRSIRILGRTFKVVKADTCPWDDDAELAAANVKLGMIWLDNYQHPEDQHLGLWHEIHEIIHHQLFTCECYEDDEVIFRMTHAKFQDVNRVLWATAIDNGLFGREDASDRLRKTNNGKK